jgi:hypothetical protein
MINNIRFHFSPGGGMWGLGEKSLDCKDTLNLLKSLITVGMLNPKLGARPQVALFNIIEKRLNYYLKKI